MALWNGSLLQNTKLPLPWQSEYGLKSPLKCLGKHDTKTAISPSLIHLEKKQLSCIPGVRQNIAQQKVAWEIRKKALLELINYNAIVIFIARYQQMTYPRSVMGNIQDYPPEQK